MRHRSEYINKKTMISSRGNKKLQEYYMYIRCIPHGPTKQYLQSNCNVSGECCPNQNYDTDT